GDDSDARTAGIVPRADGTAGVTGNPPTGDTGSGNTGEQAVTGQDQLGRAGRDEPPGDPSACGDGCTTPADPAVLAAGGGSWPQRAGRALARLLGKAGSTQPQEPAPEHEPAPQAAQAPSLKDLILEDLLAVEGSQAEVE